MQLAVTPSAATSVGAGGSRGVHASLTNAMRFYELVSSRRTAASSIRVRLLEIVDQAV